MTQIEEKHANGQGQGLGKDTGARRLKSLMIGVSVAAVLIGAGPAPAQQSGPPAQTAAEEARIAFDIPAQPLESAVTAYGFQSGYQVAVDQATLTGLKGNEVRGSFTPAEALSRLLTGTGVTYRLIDENSVTLVVASPGAADDGVIQLDPVTVEGQTESAYGPVDGYVATHSATATKTDTPIIETPRSISVVTSDEMRERGVETIGDALSYTAGVVADAGGDEVRYDTIYVRGFELSDNGIYTDGLRLSFPPSSLTKLDPFAYERVEVLKGPTSVLYGQINPGGLINSVTKRPPAEPLFSAELLYGTYDRKRSAIDVGGPLMADGALSGRLTALAQDSDAQHDFGKSDRIYVAPAIAWRPTEQTEWTVLANYQYDETGPYPGFLPASGTIDPNPNGHIPANRTAGSPNDIDEKKRYAVSSILNHQLNQHLSVRQTLRYSNVNYYSEGLFAFRLEDDGRTVRRSYYLADDEVSTFVVDNQAQAQVRTGSIGHTILAGVDYRHIDRTFEQGFDRTSFIDIFAPVYDGVYIRPDSTTTESEQSQTGFYVQEQANVGDNLFVSVGGRLDHAKNDADTSTAGSETEDRVFTWSAGLLYKTKIGLSPYFSYAESFLPQVGTDVISNEPFVPTEGRQYEAGVKWASPDERSLITLSVFHLTQDNSLTNVPGTFGSTQTGEIRSQGLELEGTIQLGDHWTLAGAYAYVDTEYTRDNELQGLEAEQSPRHLASLWVHYENLLPGLSLGGGVRHVGRRVYGYDGRGTSEVNELYHPSKTLFDANLAYTLGKVTASVDARNLFDKESFSCYGEGYGFCVPDNGREVSIRLRYDW